ncbi:histidine kinase dimerization/phospho-acceptor domain-containing protein [Phenylobacterium sp.]|jgi:signal transduction histidine kinase|uniref:histidine kinase dimerization/phospho-acceptor domain-containing protein n=1 Tax=Phenylobacterium sp. TaxID=1871053 RepID=UPI003784B9C7
MPREIAAHELNNLLCKILGAAELMQDHPMPAVLRRELETIAELAESAVELVGTLLDSPAGAGA